MIKLLIFTLINISFHILICINITQMLLKRSIHPLLLLPIGLLLSYIFMLFLSFMPYSLSIIILYILIFINLILIIEKKNRTYIRIIIKNIKDVCSVPSYIASLVLLLLFLLTIILYMYLTPLHGHDGLVIYASKAKVIYQQGIYGLFDKFILLPHNTYPLFLPLNEYFSFLIAGSIDESFSSIPFIIYLISFFSITLYLFGKKYLHLAILTLICLFVSPVFFSSDVGIVYQYADIPLSLMIFFYFVLLYKNEKSLSLLPLMIMPLIKNEGWLLLIILSFVYVFRYKNIFRLGIKRDHWIIIIITAFNILIWIIMRALLTSYIEEITFKNIINNLGSIINILSVIKDFIFRIFNVMLWGGLYLISLITLIYFSIRNIFARYITFSFISLVIAYSMIIALIPNKFFIDAYDITDRLLLHFFPTLIIFGILFICKTSVNKKAN